MNKTLVIGVAVALGALLLMRPRREATMGAYPFPTRDSHETAPIDDVQALAQWARRIGREPHEVSAAAEVVGRSKAAILDYLDRPSN